MAHSCMLPRVFGHVGVCKSSVDTLCHPDPSFYSFRSQQNPSFYFSSIAPYENEEEGTEGRSDSIRLSKLLSQHSKNLAVSRREAERLIRGGDVTYAGKVILSPHYLVSWEDLDSPGILQVSGKAVALLFDSASLQNNNNSEHRNTEQGDTRHATKVWIVHKLKGEVVADHDPQGRPSMIQRLMQGGVGKCGKRQRHHLKPIGRLDMPTEGLILVTNNGSYAREMELPANELHRTYRVRVHGPISQYKLKAIQRGIRIEDKDSYAVTRYSPMKVEMENVNKIRSSTNSWIRITCTEGKNRQIRNVLKHLGLNVTRLIRVSFGDYQLNTIPPGMALEVPLKDIGKQIHKGPLFSRRKPKAAREEIDEEAPPVQWVRHYR